jgi:MFS family permease
MCMSLWAWLSNFQAAGISSALPLMVTAFIRTEGPIPFPSLTRLISVNVLLLGVSNIWWVPLANTYGRRPIILFTILLLTGFSIWAAEAKSYHSLLAARLFMGLAAGPAETVAPDVVGEVFFVHERGRAMVCLFAVDHLELGADMVSGCVHFDVGRRSNRRRDLWKLHCWE